RAPAARRSHAMSTATARSTAPERPSGPIDKGPRRERGAYPKGYKAASARPLFDPPIVKRAIKESFGKLDPRRMVRNPVMFVVEVGSAFTTILFIHALMTGNGEAPAGFIG